MKPRIVILSAFLTPFRSGAEACVEEVPLRLFARYDFTIITAKLRRDLPRRFLLHGSIPVMRIGIGHPVDKWLFPFLAPFAARRLRPDIVHAVLESFAGLALVFCRILAPSAKRILTCQSTNTHLFIPLMHRHADRVTAISSVLMERGKSFGRDDITLIPNGISIAEIAHARGRHKRQAGRILFVGRLEQMKGVDTLLTAFAEIVNSGQWTVGSEGRSPSLRIVGDGSLRTELERLSRELGIADRVTFAGYLSPPALYDEFASAEIFAGLSRSEAFGNVFAEAQAAGLAVVATNVGGIPDIISDGVTGLLVPPDDPTAASAAIVSLLTDQAECLRLAAAGEESAKTFDWSVITERYAHLYDALFARTRDAAL